MSGEPGEVELRLQVCWWDPCPGSAAGGLQPLCAPARAVAVRVSRLPALEPGSWLLVPGSGEQD